MKTPELELTHAGQSTGSLYLSDLDTEENKHQNKGVVVYVPEGGSATLPLDEEVLHSFNQGAIKGFMDDGLLTAQLVMTDAESVEYTAADAADWDVSAPSNLKDALDRVAAHAGPIA